VVLSDVIIPACLIAIWRHLLRGRKLSNLFGLRYSYNRALESIHLLVIIYSFSLGIPVFHSVLSYSCVVCFLSLKEVSESLCDVVIQNCQLNILKRLQKQHVTIDEERISISESTVVATEFLDTMAHMADSSAEDASKDPEVFQLQPLLNIQTPQNQCSTYSWTITE
jgi:hypothetical protein